MSVVTALIVLSALGALICSRARAAGPALFFGVFAMALLSATPLGVELREGAVSVIEAGQQAAAEGGAR